MRKSLLAIIFSSFVILLLVGSVSALSLRGILSGVTGRAAVSSVECRAGQIIGDLDGDGEITYQDTRLINEILKGRIPVPEDICCADLNKDGNLNLKDRTMISRIARGYEKSPGICGYEEKPECEDSDGGKDYYVKGTLRMSSWVEGKKGVDMCINVSGSAAVWELYCDSSLRKGYIRESFICPSGICKDGACVNETIIVDNNITTCPLFPSPNPDWCRLV